jgi:hypothetical protein
MDEASLNIRRRAKIKARIAEYGKDDHWLLEARNVAIANNMFWLLMDMEISNPGGTDYQRIYDSWIEWFEVFSGRKKDIPHISQAENGTVSPSNDFCCVGDQVVQ